METGSGVGVPLHLVPGDEHSNLTAKFKNYDKGLGKGTDDSTCGISASCRGRPDEPLGLTHGNSLCSTAAGLTEARIFFQWSPFAAPNHLVR
jgi:hypothetical protein